MNLTLDGDVETVVIPEEIFEVRDLQVLRLTGLRRDYLVG